MKAINFIPLLGMGVSYQTFSDQQGNIFLKGIWFYPQISVIVNIRAYKNIYGAINISTQLYLYKEQNLLNTQICIGVLYFLW